MSRQFANTAYRAIDLDATGATSIDAVTALLRGIQEIEDQYNKDAASVTDVVAGTTSRVFHGSSPYKIHLWKIVTLTKATGVYVVEFTETVPRIEDIS